MFNKEFKRFIIAGLSTVLIDLMVYYIFIYFGIYISISKAISFSTGTIYAYFINKKWTFRAIGGTKTFIKFLVVYIFSLSLNITINKLIIELLGLNNKRTIIFAFIFSTSISALFNFFCQRNYVFKK